jgi:hypothetical protein
MKQMERYETTGAEEIARFLRNMALAFDQRMNPVFEGHRTTYPGQANIGLTQAIGFGMMYTSPSAALAVMNAELMRTRTRSVGIDPSPQGSYHLGGGETYYPFKGIVDVIFN